jgi:hypothetical protein
MKIVETEFIPDEKEDHHADSDANRQTKNIDERKDFALHQISPCSFEIIFKHKMYLS